MVNSNLSYLINFTKQNFTNDATEISDALELLNLAFDGLLNSSNIKMSELNKNKEFDKSSELIEICKSVYKVQEQINEYSSMLNIEMDIEEEDSIEEPDEVEEQKTIPNYADYVVDSSIPHTLYEDFTHKKVIAFTLNNKTYSAKDWKDVLLQTCDLLAEIDKSKFYEFTTDPVMMGRKIAYFSDKYTKNKNAKMKNINIYVWTNLSANDIKKLIRKLLKKYGIKLSNYYVYFRADYTPLHRDDKVETKTESTDGTIEEKIGKYVRLRMRQLSNKQYGFSDIELASMLSKKWSKEIIGIDYPLLREYKNNEDIATQIKDGPYDRYWKEIFDFRGRKYFVTSQWYERHRESFERWIESFSS